MATEYQIKFLKHGWGLDNGTPLVAAASTANPYAICFDTTTKQIYVGGVAYGGAISDANYANGVLTITKSNGTTQTLDFNDVASAEATLKVFAHMNELMGVTKVGTTTELSYSGTEYLTLATTLVGADKALDAQIKAVNDTIDAMDVTNVRTVTDTTTGNVISLTINGINEANGVISANNTLSTVTFATVAKTGKAEDVAVGTDGITATDVEGALVELKNAITGANITIDGHKGAITTDVNTMNGVTAEGGTFGVKVDNVYIGSGNTGVTLMHVDQTGNSVIGTDLATVNTVTTYISSEINALDVDPIELATIAENAITIKGIKEENGKISASGTTTIPVDGTVSSTNKLLTKDSLDTVVQGLNVTEYAQAVAGTDSFDVYGIYEADGKIHIGTNKVSLAIADGYNATDNKVATVKTVTDAIDELDTTSDVVPVTASDTNTQIKLTLKGIKEQNGVIADGTTISTVTFSTVAATGAAADVTVGGSTMYVGSTVDQTITSIDSRIASLEELPKYDVVVLGTEALPTASANTMHKIYLKTEDLTSSNDVYGEYITVRSGEQGSYTYSWEKLGTTAASLDGYVKTINVNGKDFTVDGNTSVKVTLGSVITNITDGDETVTTSNGFTHDYVDSEVTVISTKDATTGTYAASVISTATVKVQAVGTSGDNAKGLAEASDVKAYVGTQISNLNVNSTTVGTNVKVTYSETNGIVTINTTEEYANVGNDLVVTDGTKLVTGDDITKVKNYIGSRVQDLNVNETPVTGTNVSFKYKETNGIVEIGTLVVDYATVTGGTTDNPSITVGNGTGLVTGNDISTIKTYVDDKISTVVDSLNADVTSDDAAVATVEVVEANGVITNVIVTNINAGVTYTAAGQGTDADLTVSTATGAVTGNDITAIKNYIDAKATEASTVTSADATMTVNDSNLTTLGTVAGTPIQAKTQLVWETYD